MSEPDTIIAPLIQRCRSLLRDERLLLDQVPGELRDVAERQDDRHAQRKGEVELGPALDVIVSDVDRELLELLLDLGAEHCGYLLHFAVEDAFLRDEDLVEVLESCVTFDYV